MAEKKEESKLDKEYSILKKKYNLPSIDDIENIFGAVEVEHEKFLLSAIRKKMGEKIDYSVNILGNIFEGDTNLVNVYESKALDENKKTKLFKTYRKLMKYSRESNILALLYDEKAEAEFIKNFYKDFESIGKELKKQLEEFRDSWEDDSEIPDDIQNYLG